MMNRDTLIHLTAGGLGGTAGAIVTCPLEVVKTRLQSSKNFFEPPSANDAPSISSSTDKLQNRIQGHKQFYNNWKPSTATTFTYTSHSAFSTATTTGVKRLSLLQCFKIVVKKEGIFALWKGLTPNIMGVAPTRAIYFCAYSNAKKFFNSRLVPDSSPVHMCSAASASFITSTCTNPIWLVKTRLQLDSNVGADKLGVSRCIQKVYAEHGIRGFYRGVTASYVGISETVVHFVIYEYLKSSFVSQNNDINNNNKHSFNTFFMYMLFAGTSKCIAATLCYPHEVARTRLREEGSRYKGFCHTLSSVVREESLRGLYRGLTAHLLRQIPNTAIMMATYEMVVYFLSSSNGQSC